MTAAKAIRFIQSLDIPTGARAGKRLKLAPYQRQFIKGSIAKGINIGVLSVARGGGKSALTAGIALGHLVGAIDPQVQRECLVGARTRDQGRIVWDYCAGLARSLPEDIQKRLTFRRAPRLEIEFEAEDGPHLLRVIAADGKNVLGTSPSLVICDERATGTWTWATRWNTRCCRGSASAGAGCCLSARRHRMTRTRSRNGWMKTRTEFIAKNTRRMTAAPRTIRSR